MSQDKAPKGVGGRIAQERRLKAARDQRDIDQRDLAKAAGVTPGAVSRWESGIAEPKDDVLKRLAAYFGVSIAWLRYGEGTRVGAPSLELTEPQRGVVLRPSKGKGKGKG